jgi:hypothetical protein
MVRLSSKEWIISPIFMRSLSVGCGENEQNCDREKKSKKNLTKLSKAYFRRDVMADFNYEETEKKGTI